VAESSRTWRPPPDHGEHRSTHPTSSSSPVPTAMRPLSTPVSQLDPIHPGKRIHADLSCRSTGRERLAAPGAPTPSALCLPACAAVRARPCGPVVARSDRVSSTWAAKNPVRGNAGGGISNEGSRHRKRGVGHRKRGVGHRKRGVRHRKRGVGHRKSGAKPPKMGGSPSRGLTQATRAGRSAVPRRPVHPRCPCCLTETVPVRAGSAPAAEVLFAARGPRRAVGGA